MVIGLASQSIGASTAQANICVVVNTADSVVISASTVLTFLQQRVLVQPACVQNQSPVPVIGNKQPVDQAD